MNLRDVRATIADLLRVIEDNEAIIQDAQMWGDEEQDAVERAQAMLSALDRETGSTIADP